MKPIDYIELEVSDKDYHNPHIGVYYPPQDTTRYKVDSFLAEETGDTQYVRLHTVRR